MQTIDDEYLAYWNASKHLDADWVGVPHIPFELPNGEDSLRKVPLFQRLMRFWPSKFGTGRV